MYNIMNVTNNALVNFINSNSDWFNILSDEEGSYALKIKQSKCPGEENLWMFSYNQIKSNWRYKECYAARGIILEIIDNKVTAIVRHAFDKFFNSHEGYADKLDWKNEKIFSTEKRDGCLDENTQIETPDGLKDIKYLCENNYKGKVKSKNLSNNEVCWDYVEAVSIKNDNDDWYEIQLNSGKKIILTGSHKVWISDLKCWRQTKDLSGGEKVDVL